MGNIAELIFIPAPFVGHVMSTVEFAKLLVDRDQGLSITIFIMKNEINVINGPYSNLFANFISSENIKFINLPAVHADFSLDPLSLVNSSLELQKVHVKDVLSNFIAQPSAPKLAGFVIDMFCTPMIDLANEFNVPTYMYYAVNAGHLSLTVYFLNLHKENTKFNNPDAEFGVPGFVNSVPGKVLPSVMTENDMMGQTFVDHARRYKELKGIVVNTFMELESTALDALSKGETPPIYPVGPVLNLPNKGADGQQGTQFDDIMKWLDDQPRSSVVFLCFGSIGSFPDEQVREIAIALEKSGCRFLWSLRKRPPIGKTVLPSDYDDLSNVLPEGFSDRTIGKVIGWAPQVDVLAHPLIRGFVSHCGWNSILESLWFGVPIVTWPLYAEQQINAFLLLEEFKLAVEIMMDYRLSFSNEEHMIIGSDEIVRGIRSLLEIDAEKVQKVNELSGMSKKTLEEDEPSYVHLGKFIDDVFKNM